MLRLFALALVFLTGIATARAQESAEARLENARDQIEAGAYSAALADIKALQSASQLTPDLQRQVNALRARALLGAGYYDDAATSARAAVEASKALLRSEIADILLLAAQIEMLRADNTASNEALNQALAAAIEADGHNSIRVLRTKDRIALMTSMSLAAEAEKMTQEIIAQADRLPETPIRDKMRFLNTLGITLQRQSKFKQAREAFSAAQKGRARLLSERHPETLESTHNLGYVLRRLGQSHEADAAFNEALRFRTDVIGADHPDTLMTRVMIVRQLIDKSDFEIAVAEARAICAALTTRVGAAHVRTLEAMGDLATALFRAGSITEGVDTYRSAYLKAVQTLGETTPEAMNIGHEYAGLLYKSGRYGEALSIFQRVLTATRKIFDDENRDTLATLHSIAVVLSDLGRTEDAVVAYRYIASVLDKQVAASHPNRLSVLNNLAQALIASRNDIEALNIIQEVVRLRAASLGPEDSLTLVSRSAEAAILASMSRFAEAIANHRDVHAIRVRKFGERHADTLKSLHNLASTLRDADLHAEARPLFEQVVALRSETLGPSNIYTVTSMRGLATLLTVMGHAEEAKLLYLQIVDAAELLRAQGGLPDTLRRTFFSTVVPAYKALAFMEAQLGNFEGALRAAEFSQARTLMETSSTRGIARSVLPPRDRETLSDLEFRIANLDGRIPLVKDVGERTDLESQRNGFANKFTELNAQLKSQFPMYREAADIRLSDTKEAISLLPADGAILNFVQSGSRTMLLWIDGSGGYGSVFLPDYPNVAATLEAYHAALAKQDGIDGLRYPPPGIPRKLVWKLPDGSYRLQEVDKGPVDGGVIVADIGDIRRSLSSWLLAALPDQVLAKKRWFVSPDGPLSILPFETLQSGGRLLAETHEISLIQSISMMRLSRDRLKRYAETPREPMLAVGNPTYQVYTPTQPVVSTQGIEALRGPIGGSFTRPTWPNLPGSAKEIAALAALFNLQSGKNLFAGAMASEANLRRLKQTGELAHYRYIVFATHGYLDRQHPDMSGIVLSQLNLNENEDGYLRASELAAFDFRSDLVFISACETGVGKWISGEGVLGLPFALYAGGNGSTILTLWPVLDGSTADFVDRFFKKLTAGTSPASALAQTKREFILGEAGEDRKSPAVWAPFIFYGG